MSEWGTVHKLDDGKVRLGFQRRYPHGVSELWQALTDPERSALWWAQARGTLVAGGAWDLRWLNTPPGKPPMEWWSGSITEVEPERVFELDNSVHGLLRWELRPVVGSAAPSSAELDLNVTIGSPDRQVWLSTLVGWHLHLDHLELVLAGGTIDWSSWYTEYYPRWQRVHQEYTRTVGAQA